jgi:hypothetical protein
MKVAKKHSHLNGEEWLLVHEKDTYQEILDAIKGIDAQECRTKISKEKGRKGRALYSPVRINAEFDKRLSGLGWESTRYSYYVAHNFDQLEAMAQMPLEEQKQYLLDRGAEAIFSYNQTDYVKNRVAIEVQFGKYSFVAYDLFVKHMAFYTGRIINVGIEILPTKAMQRDMSSGIAYYEGELHNILRHGRSNPPVPLVIIGLEP